jgi:hypothetical protein
MGDMTWARSWGTFSFFLLKCITIYNKISYHYGAWKYQEIKKKLFLKKNII